MSRPFVTLALADLPVGSHTVVDVEGREVGVFNVAGHFYALPSVCPHQNGPLCRGRVSGTVVARRETGWKRAWVHEGEIIVCPWHMLEFRVTTGECVNAPKRRLPLYRVEVDGDNLRVYGGT